MFDCGIITRDLQQRFGVVSGAPENLATPENVAILLAALREQTARVIKARFDVVNPFSVLALVDTWDRAAQQWDLRLQSYERIVDAAIAAKRPKDFAFIANDVTAPLLLGFFPGIQEQRSPDAITPCILANGLNVEDSFREELFDRFIDDLKSNARDLVTPPELPEFVKVAIVAGVVALAWGLTR